MAQSDRDAELDQALRQLGDELLKQEIPDRLLHVLRSAAAAQHDSYQDPEAGPARGRTAPRSGNARSK